MISIRTALAAASTIALVVAGGARANPTLDKAREKHARSIKEAEATLLSRFEKAFDQVAALRLPPDQKLSLVDAVRAERRRFEDRGFVPWSEPMWPHLTAYLDAVQSADGQFRRTANAELDKAIRAKNDTDIDNIRAALRGTGAKVIGRWRVNGGAPVAFYSNSRIGAEDGRDSWLVEKNSRLILRWPNANAPGGAWIDTCVVSRDGTSYSATNQRGSKLRGFYSPE